MASPLMSPPAADFLTVIVPTLDEVACIGGTLSAVRRCLPAARLLVVDGGSSDGTLEEVRRFGVEAIACARGRGRQLASGARETHSEWMLFLHADTCLPIHAAAVIGKFISDAEARIATFRLRFDDDRPFLRLCGLLSRIDSVFTRFGDQGILIRRSFYVEIGGFPEWPLFEDVALLQAARRRTRIASLPAEVTTSARRFRACGPFRQQWINARLLVRFLRGETTEQLAREYRSGMSQRPPPSVSPSSTAVSVATRR